MGSLRRGLILALIPLPAWAGICETHRPDWDGGSVSMVSEAITLASSPLSLLLLIATALAFRFKSNWGALAVFVAWSFFVSGLTFFDMTGGVRGAAIAEGCVGSPAVFIGVVCVLCIGLILYTGPPPKKD